MTRAGRPTGASLAAALIALLASTAHGATPPRVRLQWSSTDERCLSAAALRQAVERTLGREVFADEPGLAEVRGQIEPVKTGFRARIELLQASQPPVQRTLSTGKVCGRLDESIAVVVALMIDSVLAPSEPVQMAVPDEPPAAEAPPKVVALPATFQGVEPPLTTGLAVTGGVGRGVLPGWTPEVGLAALVRPTPRLSAEVDLRWLATRRALHDGDLGGDFSAWLVTLRACAEPFTALTRVRYTPCLGAGSGRLAGTGVGLNANATPAGTLAFAVLTPVRLGVRLVPHVWLSADASVRLMLGRERFGFLDTQGAFESVHRPSLLAPVVSAAVTFESAQSGP